VEGAPYDRIIIDTPISVVDDSILNQLNENLGKLIIIRKINVNLCKAVSITKNKDSFSEDYLFDVFSEYELFKQQKGFEF
jgi:Protein-L-isoaspartate carboxylmethyltransferase